MSICGLDFGTSNSTVGVFQDGEAAMVPLEMNPKTGESETTLPSALFFDFESDDIHFGREAIELYTQGEFGRLMRSMKSILGSNQMDDGTQIKTNVYSFAQIIGFFMQSLKQRGEAFTDASLSQVVLGRPVHFNDNHPDLDRAAEQKLEAIARDIGFTDVSFQYEPIAAASDYESGLKGEELALIIDIGGGTSDFTVIRLSDQRRHLADRSGDLLANHGIHIGGTDFDRHLSMATVMPHYGLGLPYKDKPTLSMPKHYYVDLATWHLIHNLYEPKVLRDLTELQRNMQSPLPIQRLIELLKLKKGHRLAGAVEQTKIDLAELESTMLTIDFLEDADEFVRQVTQTHLAESIEKDVTKVFHAVDETLAQAGMRAGDIDTVFTTGGSTALPSVKALIRSTFPDVKWVSGDLFNSVGRGLVLEAERRYR
jgi:hypothetical chaperone protein